MKKPRGRPFEPGNKIGRGRPKGSRNRNAAPARELLDQFSIPLTRKAISMALAGNSQLMRQCLEWIIPAPRGTGVLINLSNIKSTSDVVGAAERVTRGIGKGTLSPSEGEKMMNVLHTHSRLIESSETEKRVEKLEEHLAATKAISGMMSMRKCSPIAAGLDPRTVPTIPKMFRGGEV